MKMTVKVASYIYTSDSCEQAYINGCKDLCKSIKDPKISINIEKMDDGKSVKFNVFVSLNANESISNFCKVCKEFHCSFYINEEYNCARCNLKSFMKRMKQQLNTSKSYYRKEIE